MSWIVVKPEITGSASDWRTVYLSSMVHRATRSEAIQHGWLIYGHDDWLVGEVEGTELLRLAWCREDRDDPDELADAAGQLGLSIRRSNGGES